MANAPLHMRETYYEVGTSNELLSIVSTIIPERSSGKPYRYKVQCSCGRSFWCSGERYINGTDYNERAGRRTHQCSKKCPY